MTPGVGPTELYVGEKEEGVWKAGVYVGGRGEGEGVSKAGGERLVRPSSSLPLFLRSLAQCRESILEPAEMSINPRRGSAARLRTYRAAPTPRDTQLRCSISMAGGRGTPPGNAPFPGFSLLPALLGVPGGSLGSFPGHPL